MTNKPLQPPPVTNPLKTTGNQPATTATLTPNDKTTLFPLIDDLQLARGGNTAIVWWLTDAAKISDSVVAPLYDQLSSIGKQGCLDLVLFTRGGDTEVPWRIVSLIREFCNKFSVLVPSRAASSGTLLALGADEIVMTPLGVLGPIDPSRTHPLLPRREGAEEAEPISVQDMRHAMNFILNTAKPNNEMVYTPDAMAQIVTSLFDKIHPLAIGAIEQSYALSKLIGTRCLGTHLDPVKDKTKIEDIVNRLCDDYKSHAYPICRKEAREIGLNVIDADAQVDAALMKLVKFYLGRPSGGPPAKITAGQNFKIYIGWLDSKNIQIRCEAEFHAEQTDKAKLIGDKWVNY